MRTRRPAPPFRRGRVIAIEDVTPWLRRVVVEGDELREFEPGLPGGGARLLLPAAPDRPVDLPVWNGNAYFAEDGSRPPIRTVTPLDPDPERGRLAVELVRHDAGLLTPWVETVALGGEVAVSGPSRGYEVGDDVTSLVVVGDETALPAIRQLVAAAPHTCDVSVVVEARPVADDAALLPAHPRLTLARVDAEAGAEPGTALLSSLPNGIGADGSRLWAAGEAAAMQRLRTHLFTERGLDRSAAHVRGYWKHGRSEDPDVLH